MQLSSEKIGKSPPNIEACEAGRQGIQLRRRREHGCLSRSGCSVAAPSVAPATQAPRRATDTGVRAARIAGKTPPTKPIVTAKIIPDRSAPGVTLKAYAT